MKKHIIIFVASLFLGAVSYSQQLITQVKPAGSKLWGYANEKGELVIPAEYTKCEKFSPEGVAIIYDKKDIYLIDTKGGIITTDISNFKLKSFFGFGVDGFKDGLLLIGKDKKWGYLDTKGKLIVPMEYDDANDFSDGFAAVKKGNKIMLLNSKGQEIEISEPDVIDVKDFSEGMAPYRANNKKFGFITSDGKVAIPPQFESVGYFTEGLAWAKAADGKLGYINKKGDWVINPQFSAGKEFEKMSGLARVKDGDKWVYVNKKGDIKNISDAEALGDFSEGLADGKKGDKKGFYDNTGKWVIAPQFDGTRDFKNGYAAAKKDDKWGMIDKTGKWVIEPKFDSIKDLELIKK